MTSTITNISRGPNGLTGPAGGAHRVADGAANALAPQPFRNLCRKLQLRFLCYLGLLLFKALWMTKMTFKPCLRTLSKSSSESLRVRKSAGLIRKIRSLVFKDLGIPVSLISLSKEIKMKVPAKPINKEIPQEQSCEAPLKELLREPRSIRGSAVASRLGGSRFRLSGLRSQSRMVPLSVLLFNQHEKPFATRPNQSKTE